MKGPAIEITRPAADNAVIVTDTALRAITEEIARHEPERGGALLGPIGLAAVTRFVADPLGATTHSSYRSSAELGMKVRAIEAANPLLEFKGIVHSHPGAMDSPSQQDQVAFADSLTLNDWMPAFIAPIVVRQQPWRLEEHAMHRHPLADEGWMTMWVAERTPGETATGRKIRATHLERDLERLVELGLTMSGPPVLIEHEGHVVLAASLAGSNDSLLRGSTTLVFPWDYPEVAPLVVHVDDLPSPAKSEPSELTIAWDPKVDPEERLVTCLRQTLVNETAASEAEHKQERAGLRSRLQGVVGAELWQRSVAVFGVGSVGSHMAELLVRSGVERINLVDPDVVEMANLSRCPFTIDDVGQPKVAVVGRRLGRINRHVAVESLPIAVNDLEGPNLANLISNVDLVIAATDDPAAQLRLNHHAYAAGIPAVYPAIYARGRGGEVIASVPGVTPCFRCSTVGRSHLQSRPSQDYGTGRLVAEPALGADILHVTTAAAKIATGLLNWSPASTDLDNFIVGALSAGSYLMLGTTPGFEFFDDVFNDTAAQFAYQSVWLQPSRSAECAICGDADRRVDPAYLDGQGPDLTRVTGEPIYPATSQKYNQTAGWIRTHLRLSLRTRCLQRTTTKAP